MFAATSATNESFSTFWSAVFTTAPILGLAVILESRWIIARERSKGSPSLGLIRFYALFHGATIFALGATTINAVLTLSLDVDVPILRMFAVLAVIMAVSLLITAPAGQFLNLGFAGLRPATIGATLSLRHRIRIWRWRRRLGRLKRRHAAGWRSFVRARQISRTDRLVLRVRESYRRVVRKELPDEASRAELEARVRGLLMEGYRALEVQAAALHYLEEEISQTAAERRSEDREIVRTAVAREFQRIARYVDEPPELWMSGRFGSGDQSTGRGGQR